MNLIRGITALLVLIPEKTVKFCFFGTKDVQEMEYNVQRQSVGDKMNCTSTVRLRFKFESDNLWSRPSGAARRRRSKRACSRTD